MDFDKVTTRGGDKGDSSLYNGERLGKDDLLFEAMGDLDELASYLGVLKASLKNSVYKNNITEIQENILKIGSEIATPKKDPLYNEISHLTKEDILTLEKKEKALLDNTNIEDKFVIQGDNLQSAHADYARAVCRRAERKLVRCIRERELIQLAAAQNYLNRLSDYLFLMARKLS